MAIASAAGYAADIRPKFRPHDIACMKPKGVRLDDADWMRDPAADADYPDHANARRVFDRLQAGDMPPDAAWPAEWVTAFQSWMDGGFEP